MRKTSWHIRAPAAQHVLDMSTLEWHWKMPTVSSNQLIGKCGKMMQQCNATYSQHPSIALPGSNSRKRMQQARIAKTTVSAAMQLAQIKKWDWQSRLSSCSKVYSSWDDGHVGDVGDVHWDDLGYKYMIDDEKGYWELWRCRMTWSRGSTGVIGVEKYEQSVN